MKKLRSGLLGTTANYAPPDEVGAAPEAPQGTTAQPTYDPPKNEPAPRADRKGRPQQARAPPDAPIDAMSVAEFCRRHSISEDYFYKLQREGRGPRTMKIGARTLVSQESARAWRRAQERKTAAAAP
jgi:hypothetical protein